MDKDRNLRYQSAAEMRTDMLRLKRELESGSNPSAVIDIPVEQTPRSSTAITPGVTPSGSSPSAGAAAASSSGSAFVPVAPNPLRKWLPLLSAIFLLVALAIGASLFWTRHARALTEKDTVVLSDFVNTTGDAVFDGPLKQALAVQLEQSPYLNLARAYALQGDNPKSRTAYQDFVALWKDADPDIPVFVAAKSEYAKLK